MEELKVLDHGDVFDDGHLVISLDNGFRAVIEVGGRLGREACPGGAQTESVVGAAAKGGLQHYARADVLGEGADVAIGPAELEKARQSALGG